MRSAAPLVRLLLACTGVLACTSSPAGTTGPASGSSGDMSSSTGPEDPTTGGGATAIGSEGSASTGSGGSSSGAAADPCGQPPPFTGLMPQTIEAAGLQRDYDLAIPADYDPSEHYPLVFAWHGRGGSGELARLYFKIEEAAQGQAIVVYPDGLPLPEMDNQTGWDLSPEGEDVALFDAILADVSARLCVDPARVFSAGHSFGGFMSNAIGCARAGVVRAIAPVAGGGPYFSCVPEQVAVWLTHGQSDSTVPFSEGEASRDRWVAANHCQVGAEPVEPAPCTAYTGCDAAFPVHWCPHDEPGLGGHAWPDWAGAAIWAFFAGL